MMNKTEISKKEYQEIIDEILLCQKAIEKQLGVYVSNSIARLIEARIKLAHSSTKKDSDREIEEILKK